MLITNTPYCAPLLPSSTKYIIEQKAKQIKRVKKNECTPKKEKTEEKRRQRRERQKMNRKAKEIRTDNIKRKEEKFKNQCCKCQVEMRIK